MEKTLRSTQVVLKFSTHSPPYLAFSNVLLLLSSRLNYVSKIAQSIDEAINNELEINKQGVQVLIQQRINQKKRGSRKQQTTSLIMHCIDGEISLGEREKKLLYTNTPSNQKVNQPSLIPVQETMKNIKNFK